MINSNSAFFRQSLKLSFLPGALFFFIAVFRFAIIFSSSDSLIVTIVPDDSFYYLKLACNFADKRVWSFDGLNHTSGFHLVYAYYLSFLTKIIGCASWKTIFFINGCIACLVIALVFNVVFNYISQRSNVFFALISSIPFFSTPIISQTTANMESSWTFPLALLFAVHLDKISFNLATPNKLYPLKIKYFLIVFSAFFLVLTRSDLSILIGVIAINSLIVIFLQNFYVVHCYNNGTLMRSFFNNQIKRVCLYLLTGVAFGVVFVILHSYTFTGDFLQNSVLIKKHWSSVLGNSSLPAFSLFLTLFLPSFVADKFTNYYIFSFFILLLTSLSIMPYLFFITAKDKFSLISKYGMASLAAPLVLITYLIVYGLNSQALQQWYSAQLITPLVMSVVLLSSLIKHANFKEVRQKFRYAFILPLLVLATWFTNHLVYPSRPLYPNQALMLDAIRKFNSLKGQSKLSGWNSGLPGYFSYNFYSNIDGLVNSTVSNYIISDNLYEYLVKRDYDFIIDYRYMMTDTNMKLRGGYFNNAITTKPCAVLARLQPSHESSYDVCAWEIIKEGTNS